MTCMVKLLPRYRLSRNSDISPILLGVRTGNQVSKFPVHASLLDFTLYSIEEEFLMKGETKS